MISQESISSFQEKVDSLQKKFLQFSKEEEKYHFLIGLGKEAPRMDPSHMTEENLVKGCQSRLFLNTEVIEDKLFFTADSDALISKGLAALLVHVYSGETAATILNTPPTFLQSLGILSSLSPNRAQGALHIYLKMKLAAIKSLST